MEFQSTLPEKGATQVQQHHVALIDISIHAPREGSDAWKRSKKRHPKYFNPRSPRRERPGRCDVEIGVVKFQSTLPEKGATVIG